MVWIEAVDPDRCGADHVRAPVDRTHFVHGDAYAFLYRFDPHRSRHRIAQAEYLGHRWRPLSRGRSTTGRGVLGLLHGDQSWGHAWSARYRHTGREDRLRLGLWRRGRGYACGFAVVHVSSETNT